MTRLYTIFLLLFFINIHAYAQEAFTIRHYHVGIKVNHDASLDITEVIQAHFNEERHGIIRRIPFKYQLEPLPDAINKAHRQMESNGFTRTIVENIQVPGWNYNVSTSGNFKEVKIGSAERYVNGDQQFIINYRILNAINFFNDHSELYFNIIGDQWDTSIDSADFTVQLYAPLSTIPEYFVATGATGSRDNNTISKWLSGTTFTGKTTAPLHANEGLTIGISFPKDFLAQQNYSQRGIYWLLLPVIVFFLMYNIWKKWGKDEKVTIQTQFYPPENISPSICGYIIDDKLDRRDLTALVPYWGAGGYLKINEIQKSSLLGLIKTKEYEFVKIKDLPENAFSFEKTLFNGIFTKGETVNLKDLKDVLYVTMNTAKSQLENEIDKDEYYVKYSRGIAILLLVAGILVLIAGIFQLVTDWPDNFWLGISLVATSMSILVFGIFMGKRAPKGTRLYQQLRGFKEFLKTVEKDRLQEFLKQDENYFDIVLPYAIVFNIADTWKDKLKGLEIPPPKWYSGYYGGNNFNTFLFMNNLDRSMSAMTNSFYSTPHSSGSSGGSFSGGGGFSGGGFGGGGGSSW
jgi:uncharacterized membrane protein